MQRLTLVGLLSIALLGCAQNAILELQIQLPAAPMGEIWYAQVQLRPGVDADLELAWMGGDIPESTMLTTEPRWDCLSVQTLDTTASLTVRVRFCRAPNCLDLEDANAPERLYRIERPFHAAATTYLQLLIPRVPDCTVNSDCEVGVCAEGRCGCSDATDCGAGYECLPRAGCVRNIGRCEVEGCIAGPVSVTFCTAEGEHFCERSVGIRRDSTWACH